MLYICGFLKHNCDEKRRIAFLSKNNYQEDLESRKLRMAPEKSMEDSRSQGHPEHGSKPTSSISESPGKARSSGAGSLVRSFPLYIFSRQRITFPTQVPLVCIPLTFLSCFRLSLSLSLILSLSLSLCIHRSGRRNLLYLSLSLSLSLFLCFFSWIVAQPRPQFSAVHRSRPHSLL